MFFQVTWAQKLVQLEADALASPSKAPCHHSPCRSHGDCGYPTEQRKKPQISEGSHYTRPPSQDCAGMSGCISQCS